MNRNTLLLVDDMEVNRAILRNLFEQDYNLLEAENGEQALMLINQYQDSIAAALLDVVMPVKDGYQVMKEMSENGLLDKIPVIVITAQDSTESEVRAFDLGASDIIMKPFESHVVKRRVQNVVELNRHKLHLEDLVEEQAVNLRESKEVLMDALSSVIEHRSIESGQHVLRIRMFTKVILEDVMQSYPEYGLDERKIEIIASAAALHDIGKIAIPDAILNKPGKLTAEEFEIMKTHTEKGCEILAGLDRMHDKEYLSYAYNICRYHHERWDGKGYPDGLKGENIPICAQAVGIADAYDALTTDRVYKKAYTPQKAYNMILNGECGRFSPRLLECFKKVREQFVALTRDYADGLSPKKDFEKLSNSGASQVRLENENTLEFGQMKYFAMLRYEDSTVMEVDIDSGVYHLVYLQNNDFESLCSSSLFEKSFRIFAETAVHPDDRSVVLQFFDGYIQNFFQSGFMRHSRKYRVLHRATGEYVWCEATVLRVMVDNPAQHKVLIVWKELSGASAGKNRDASGDSAMEKSLLIGILQCRNDQQFTITYMNEGFVTLFGYGKEEIQEKFQNSYFQMIDSDDRQSLLRQFHDQLNNGNSVELEYRVKHKNGQVLWLLEKSQTYQGEDGCEYLNCVLIDITQTKQEQEQLRLTMERHQIIMDQTNDIIFEWDIAEDTISYSSNWFNKFGYLPIAEQIATKIPQASHILPEDIQSFVKLMQDVVSGLPYGEAELRIANSDGRYIWCRIRATTQFDDSGRPVKAVGVILDIDSEKRRAQDLIEKADRDNLTHLYNKDAARRRIEHFLKQREASETAAMMIIDLDNFKLVNDSHGHMFGDAVLVEVSRQLQKLFRSRDVVARIGGDEFMVFVTNLPNREILEEQAGKVITVFQNILEDNLQDCMLSCSMGIACCPEDGTNYQDLFQQCDQALYRAKAQGKNQFVLFNKSTMSKTFGLNTLQMAMLRTQIDSDDLSDYETNGIVQQAFKELYEAGDVVLAVNSILEMVGKKYHTSRAYIFEDAEDGRSCSNTFEWCAEGIEPQIDSLQNIKYVELGDDYHGNFDENGIFYCADVTSLPKEQYVILAPQGVQSVLQCAIRDDGKFKGFVGFDDCKSKRMWTQSQINALTFVSELLSTFLLKKRAQDRAETMARDLEMVLDNQNSWIYVIDPDTYLLRYINAKTREIAPDSQIGMPCYQAFFDRRQPCDQCPARNIREKVNQTMEVYNPVLKVWTIADASFIHWGQQDACLLSCHDITPYKREEK